MARWRWLYEDKPGTPTRNMAADAALLCEIGKSPEALPIVRAYHWDRPCVSVGRLQNEAPVRAAYPHLPLVRRPTGGRAVSHSDDLTVSVAARLSDLPSGSESGILPTYRLIAGALMDTLCMLGIPACFGESTSQDGQATSVDCFATTARCDILDRRNGRKLVGCAQRREGEALLQQMNIPRNNIPADVSDKTFLEGMRHFLAFRLGISLWVNVSLEG